MKSSIKKTLCIILTMCIIFSAFVFPVYADNTASSTDFNSLDQQKLQIAINSLQTPTVEGIALAKDIYTHAFSYNFNMKNTVAEVLDQVFVNGYSEDDFTNDTATEGTSTVVINVMNTIVPTFYSHIPENLSSYFNGAPSQNPSSADLITGDLLLMEVSGEGSIYIYNGKHFIKLVKPSLIREDADTVLSSALSADRYVVLRPSNELSAIHRTTEGELNLTDAQKAVIGTAETYLLRGYRIQYDDTTPFTKNSYRWNSGLRTPEESSFDNIGFTNCAAFTSEVYKTALGFTDVSYTTGSQIWSAYTVWRYPQDTSASIGGETEKQKAEIEEDFYNNIQPGDIINIRYVKSKGGGHAMLYIGNGNIIHSGGYNYNFSTGDVTEASIKQMRVEELFDPANKRYVFSKLNSINLVRPLKSFNGTIPQNTINRITTMKGIVGEKLSSKNRFSTVNPGDEITYTFRVFNSNDVEKTLEIKDTVPENTTYVSGGLTNNNGELSSSITVPAYETKEISYTVKVNENAQDGIWITSNDATIGGVIHKTYEIPVRETLTSAQQTAVSEAIQNNSSLASSTDKGIAYANKIYKDVLNIDAVLAHDDVADIKNLLFPAIDEYTVITGVTASDYIGAYHLDSNSHYAQMLVPRMFGGRRVVTELHADKIIQKLEHNQFVTGDIILTESSSATTLYMYDNQKILNLSSGSYLSSADSFFDKIFANNCFAVLRPSMSDTYEYVKSQLEVYIEELKELNKTTITDDEVLEEFETIVAGIDTYLAENTTEKLSSVQQLVYDTAKTKINNYKNPPVVVPEEHITAKGKIWFALGGNSKFFVKTDEEAYLNRANYTDFLPGVDFAGYVASPTGIFTTDQAAITLPGFGGSMLAYTVNENPSNTGYTTIPDFTLEDDGNYYWTIKGTPYLIRPANNVIKLFETAPKTTAITDQEIKDRYASLTSTTIDVPDKKYESLGFLAACVTAYRKYYKVTLYYADGTTDVQVEEINATYNPNDYSATYKDGQVYLANFLNTNNERDARFGFVPWDVDIDSSKVITQVKFEIDAADTNTTRAGHIISAWGVPVDGVEEPQPSALDTLVTELEALNNAGITSDSALSAVEAKVAEIDAYLTENTDITLTENQQAIYDTAKAKIKAYKDAQTPDDTTDNSIYADGKVWFDLNGNARFFVKSTDDAYVNRTTYKDYLPGVDFAGTVQYPSGDFAADQAAVKFPNNGGAMFAYTVDEKPSSISGTTIPDLTKTGDNYYWTVNGIPYLLRVNENVIKIAGIGGTYGANVTAADKAKYQSLRDGTTIDVPDKKYQSLGFLVGTVNKYRKSYDISVYYQGEETPVTTTITIGGGENTGGENYTYGNVTLQAFTNAATVAENKYNFVPKEIPVDSSKTVTAIKFCEDYVHNYNIARSGMIISAWGIEKEVTLDELITELSALNTAGITDLNSLNALKAKVKEIDAHLAKTSAELTSAQKLVYDTALTLIAEKESEFSSATDNLKSRINIKFIGNSKLYMQYGSDEYLNRSTLRNYLPGLDFTSKIANPTGNFDTDYNYVTTTGEMFSGPLAVFPYTVNGATGTVTSTSVPNFTTDAKGNTIWTISNTPYIVKPTEKVIKLNTACSTSSITNSTTLTDKQKEELVAAYGSLKEVTIDVADGQYEKFNFLAGIFHTDITYNRILDIKLVYSDGEVASTAKISSQATTNNNYTTGSLYFHEIADGTTSGIKLWHSFRPYEVTADPSKTLTAIKLIAPTTYEKSDGTVAATGAYVYPVYVLSIYADQTIKGALSAISATSSYADALAAVNTVDAILAENNLTTTDLSPSSKASYNLAKAIVGNAADIFAQSIKQATDAMKSITADSTITDAKAAEKLYKDALSIEGIEESHFDQTIVANFYALFNTIKENTQLTGKIEIVYNKDALPYAKVTINNPSELSGKPYKVILAYYNEANNLINKQIFDEVSTIAEKHSYEIEINNLPENTKTIKGFIWKDFATLLPLAEGAVATKSDKNVLKVLAIGNSFSNNALAYFYDIAKSAGYDEVVLGVAYIGGCTLQTHVSQYNGNKTGYVYRKKTTGSWVESPSYDLKSIIKDERWDYITLQQGSTASGQPDTFEPYLEDLIKAVNDNKTNSKAKLLWHTTWTFTSNYTRDSQYKTLYNEDQMTMYNAIIDTFNSKVQPFITSGTIEYAIPAGTAVQNVREAYSDESLLSSDGLHLDNTGNYIAGLTWFEKITGKSIDTVTYVPAITGIEEKLDIIKTSVKNALKNPTSVTK